MNLPGWGFNWALVAVSVEDGTRLSDMRSDGDRDTEQGDTDDFRFLLRSCEMCNENFVARQFRIRRHRYLCVCQYVFVWAAMPAGKAQNCSNYSSKYA